MKHRIYHQFELIDEGDHVDDGQYTIENLAGDLNKNSITDSDAPVIIKGLTVVPTGPASDHVEVSEGYGAQIDGKPLIHDGTLGTIDVDLSGAVVGHYCTIEIQYVVEDTENQLRTFIDAAGATSTALVDKLRTAAIAVQYNSQAVTAPAITAGWVKIAEVVAGAAIAVGDIKNVDAYYSGVNNTGWTSDKQATLKIRSLKQHRDIFDHALGTVDYTHLNSVLKALIDESQYDIVISEQGTGTAADFEYWFGDGSETTPAGGSEIAGGWTYTVAAGITTVQVPEGTRILLLPCTTGGTVTTVNGNRAFILKTRVLLLDMVEIRGLSEENTIVTLGSRGTVGETGFETTYTSATTGNSTDGSNQLLLVASTTNLYEGQYIIFQHDAEMLDENDFELVKVYRITDITGDTVTLDKKVSATQVGGWIRVPTFSIVMKGFMVDGQGGIGQSEETPAYLNHYVFDIQYCVWSEFTFRAENIFSGNGAGTGVFEIYQCAESFYCRIGNIRQCKTERAAVVDTLALSEIFDIHDCESIGVAGSPCIIHSCFWCYIHDLSGLIVAGSRGVVHDCYWCVIERVSNCQQTLVTGTGVLSGNDYSTIRDISNCTVANNGGAVEACDYSNISNIRNCTAADKGGGVYNCDYSIIDGVRDCSVLAGGTGGGGVADSNYCTIRNLVNCTAADSDGGGIFNCDYCCIENVQECTAPAGDGGGIHSSDYCSVAHIRDCAAVNGAGMHTCDESKVGFIEGCVASTNGGGLNNCDSCAVDSIQSCSAVDGGGAYDCDAMAIQHIFLCVASNDGGGVNDVDYSVIGNIDACDADGVGGGAAGCQGTWFGPIDGCIINTGPGSAAADGCTQCTFNGANSNSSKGNPRYAIENGDRNTFYGRYTYNYDDQGGPNYFNVESTNSGGWFGYNNTNTRDIANVWASPGAGGVPPGAGGALENIVI